MKIKSFSFSSCEKNWYIEEVFLENLNLLVGASGVGKTTIIRALDLICDVAKGKRVKLDDVQWKILFSHLNTEYLWELTISKDSVESFSSELGQPEIASERIIKIEGEKSTEILYRDSEESRLNGEKIYKFKRTESAISILEEEDLISPLSEAFKRFIFDDIDVAPQAILNIPFNPEKGIAAFKDSENPLKDFKESLVSTPPIFKAYYLKQVFPEEFSDLMGFYQEIFPEVEDISIEVDRDSSDYQLFFKIKQSGLDYWIPQGDISSGMYRTLNYLIEIYSAPDESVIVIDEFENSLGINCMPQLTEFILDKSPDIQFILTSHHPYIINQIPWETWSIVRRSKNIIRATKATDIDALNTQSNLDKFTQLINLLDDEGEI